MSLFQKLDDEMHFWAGMLISLFTFILANFLFNQSLSAIVSYGFVICGAIAKELYDKHIKKTRFDWRDIKWTLIGGIILPCLFIIFDIIYYYSEP